MNRDIENHMVLPYADDEPTETEEVDTYEFDRQRRIDELNEVLRDIGRSGFMKRKQAE